MRKYVHPLLSALVLLLPLSIVAQDIIVVDHGIECGLEGSAKRDFVKEYNRQKNRYHFPNKTDFDTGITLETLLQKKPDKGRFDVNAAAEIRGYIYEVKPGGKETCNCGASSIAFRDTHIELVPSMAETAKENRVIVEVTPRIRQILAKQGIDWSTDELKKLKGKEVLVQGWMFLDGMHLKDAFSNDPEDKDHRNWRATSWEIHPVTDITVLEEDEVEDVEKAAPVFNSFSAGFQPPSGGPQDGGDPMSPTDYLVLILLGGILGMAGQGIRVVIGLKKISDANDVTDYQRTAFSLFIAFAIGGIAGVLAAVNAVDAEIDKAAIIAFITAGYAGTDFIEGFMNRKPSRPSSDSTYDNQQVGKLKTK